jgi:apolipoprotein N-acyltransferase
VQGGGPRGFRAVYSDSSRVFDAHLSVSDRIQPGAVDLVLWPENTVDVPMLAGSAEEQALSDLARRAAATLVVGVTTDAGESSFENLAVVWGPDGRIIDRYAKVHRVPFGEYVPGRALFEHLADLSVLPRDAVAGRTAGVIHAPPPLFRAAVSISYEVFFSSGARDGVRSGGRILLVPTNAASYATSQVPTQEVAAARLRAWETGRWVLQAAPTGYSAVIDERGRVLQRSVLGRAQLLTARARLRDGATPYVRAGDAPVVVIALAMVVLPWVRRMRGSRS